MNNRKQIETLMNENQLLKTLNAALEDKLKRNESHCQASCFKKEKSTTFLHLTKSINRMMIFIIPLFLSFSLTGQIKVYETAKFEEVGRTPGKWTVLEKAGDTYRITYRDPAFTQIVKEESIVFKDVDNTVNDLFMVIMNGLEDPPENDIEIEFPEDIIRLNFDKQMGVPVVRFIHYIDKTDVTASTQYYSKKWIEKLFGK